jgi:hypothetical protein
MWSLTPAAIAGVMRSDLWTRPKLYQQYQSTTAAQWVAHFLEKPLVRRANCRIPIRRIELDQRGSSLESAPTHQPTFGALPDWEHPRWNLRPVQSLTMMVVANAPWLLFSLVVAAGLLLWPPVERTARSHCAKPLWCGALIAALPVLLRLALLPHHPEPTPAGADDFSYLLLSDTLAHFRLANPPHPMHRFFEANFIFQEPRYSSTFPPAQGLFLAAGQILTGHPWAGVLLSEATLCALCYWMLLGWTTPLCALAGGLFAVCGFGPLSQWMNSYWGGAAAGIAGCLMFGSLPRLSGGGIAPAMLLGAGLGLSWLARPFETALAALSVALYFVLVPRETEAHKLVRIAPWVLMAAAPFAAFSLLHNRAVTGHATTLPYMLSREQYGVPAAFTFQANPIPQRPLTPEQQLDYRAQSIVHGDGDTPARFASRFVERVGIYQFFFYPPLYLALIAFLASLREMRYRWVLAIVFVFALGTNFYPYFYPHYIAALTCVFVLMSVTGLRELSRLRLGGSMVGPVAARLILLLYAAWFLFLFGGHMTGDERRLTEIARLDPAHFINWGDAEGRARVNQELARMPGEQLVFVRYAPRHGFHEWIHNAADIDHAKVVWALDLGASENRELTGYYPQRTTWLIEPDLSPPRLTPYRPPPPESTIPETRTAEPVTALTPTTRRAPARHPDRDEIPSLPESGFLKHRP